MTVPGLVGAGGERDDEEGAEGGEHVPSLEEGGDLEVAMVADLDVTGGRGRPEC